MANITAFKHILHNVEFMVYCDHSALVHIVQAKRGPPTLRLQKLVENLMCYKFKIKFLKGKEMYVTDFLSRNPNNDFKSPNEIIPIAFLLKDIQKPYFVNDPKLRMISNHNCTKCHDIINVMTRSQAKQQHAIVPSMYPLQGDHRKPKEVKKGIITIPEIVDLQTKT